MSLLVPQEKMLGIKIYNDRYYFFVCEKALV